MIFLDSSYIKGLILKNDDYNRLSKRIKPYLVNETKVINTTVMLEVMNSIKKNNHDKDVKELLDCLKTLDVFDFLAWNDYHSSLQWFNYYDESINFSDCTIINSMIKHNVQRIASFDSDFDKIQGFERIH
jgi:hypothetical protein